MTPSGLYIHVPFCIRKCLYCNFYVVPLGEGPLPKRMREFRDRKHQRFLDALEQEFKQLPADFQPETVYVGGGTPTELPPEDVDRLFSLLHTHVDLSRMTELSCEANPGTLDQHMADTLVQNGVNRVSLGVQSFEDKTLELLGRIHNAADAREAVQVLREAGIDNLSLDLLFGLPTEQETASRNLEAIADLKPDHVSWYSLEYEAGTAFTALRDRGDLYQPSDEETEKEYTTLRRGLTEQGFRQYELFSFTQPGHECRHNLNYWLGGEYHACGPSAHRHVQGIRSANPADVEAYLSNSLQPESIEGLDPDQKARERLMTGLRIIAGVDLQAFERHTGTSPEALMGKSYQAWQDAGWIEEVQGRLRLRPEAYLISDSLFREFL